jgi:hypothetical protein
MKIGVVGSRTFENYERLKTILDGFKPTTIVSGMLMKMSLKPLYTYQNGISMVMRLDLDEILI